MAAPLRPMNLGEILDRTFEIYRKNLLVFLGIAAIVEAVVFALALLSFDWLQLGALMRPWGFYISLVFYDISGVLIVLAFPAFVHSTTNALFGAEVSITAALRFSGSHWRGYLWIAVLEQLAGLILPELLMLGALWGTIYGLRMLRMPFQQTITLAGFATLAEVAIAILLAVWIGIGLSFSVPVAAIERTSGFKALCRSWRLTKKTRWRVALTSLIPVASAWVLAAALEFVGGQLLQGLFPGQHFGITDQQIYFSASSILQFLIAVIATPIPPIAITLLYYDQRVRKEGYDLEKMMEAAGMTATVAGGIVKSDEGPANEVGSGEESGLNRANEEISARG